MPFSYPPQIKVEVDLELEGYEFMGKQEIGSHIYFGYKKWGAPDWRITRKDITDESAWQYTFGATGWSAAWADPTALSYSDPPDA